jgi:hypothetical protein
VKMTEKEYAKLHGWVFRDWYPGFKPEVTESPHGDTRWDRKKHYAHIARKYLEGYNGPGSYYMQSLLDDWVQYARGVAVDLGVPPKYWPEYEDSTIRILAYPPGGGTEEHTDFCLFTIPMYRNITNTYEAKFGHPSRLGHVDKVHIGELLERINPNLKATPHCVVPDVQGRHQYAAVFFAMPRLSISLPDGQRIDEWLGERKGRSRQEILR